MVGVIDICRYMRKKKIQKEIERIKSIRNELIEDPWKCKVFFECVLMYMCMLKIERKNES